MNTTLRTLLSLFAPAAVAATLTLAACGGGGADNGTASTSVVAGVSTGGTGAYAAGRISGFGSVIVGGVEFDDGSASVIDDDGNAVVRTGSELRLGMTVGIAAGAISPAPSATANPSAVAATIRINSEVVGRVSAVDAAAGTLTVLGQTVQTNAATVLDAAIGGSLSTLQGQVVEVYALPGASSGSLVATRIELSAATVFKLRGSIAAVDGTAKTLRIGGLTLSYAGASGVPAALIVGNVVRLRLQTAANAAGIWPIANFVAGLPVPGDGSNARFEGVVSGYSAGAASFTLNGITVDTSRLTLPSGFGNGVRLEVRGQMSGGSLVASTVEVDDDAQGNAQQFELKGSIASLDTTAKTFVVRGVTVDYSAARYENGSAAQLKVGTKVEVEGVLSADRARVMATQIEFSDD